MLRKTDWFERWFSGRDHFHRVWRRGSLSLDPSILQETLFCQHQPLDHRGLPASVHSTVTWSTGVQTRSTCCFYTLSKVQKIRVILRRSENTFHLLQWLSMGKQFLKFKQIKKTFVPKIILDNYILYKGDPTYVTISPVDSGMHQIFTDFQHSTWWWPTSCWKICEYQIHP